MRISVKSAMNSEEPKIVKRYKKIAEKHIANGVPGRDDKRHDRIGDPEARTMVKAYNNGLSFKKIAVLFKRDWRSVKNVIKSGKTGSLDLSILMPGSRVIDFKTNNYARLVGFRIGNTSSDIIVVQKICLEVLETEKHDRGPRVEGRISPYKYDTKLSLGKEGEYPITDDKFKLPRNDIDDFELLCTSQPGTIYRARVKVYYSEHPSIRTTSVCSEELRLEFPKVKGRIGKKLTLDFKFVCATRRDYLHHLASFIGTVSLLEDGELRLYLEQPLPDEVVKAIEAELAESGVDLCDPIQQDAHILLIRFRRGETMATAISRIDIPNLIGWQLFGSQHEILGGMREFNESTAIIEK
jgi:hypothetical protein